MRQRDLEKLTCAKLRLMLKKKKLSTKGKKSELLERLRDLSPPRAATGSETDKPTIESDSAIPPSPATSRHSEAAQAVSSSNVITHSSEANKRKREEARVGGGAVSKKAKPEFGCSAENFISRGATMVSSYVPKKARGLNVSGRFWKKPQKKYSLRKSKADQDRLWAKKEAGKAKYREMKAIEKDFLAKRQAERETRIAKLVEKRKRKAENEMKNASFQIIKDDSKIKRMSKKQLRLVKKMQVNVNTGVAEFVSPWAGKQIRGKYRKGF